MAKYIEREKAIEKMCEGCNIDFSDQPCEPCDCRLQRGLWELPTADVVEVRHGEWIYCPETINLRSHFYCSACNSMRFEHYTKNNFRYCPNCGAKMDGKEIANNG